ncbi:MULTISPECIES: hypothetical protein [unclassified Lysobacter]|uniref:hypothetical protein n=1 Tax=unclassified Lysobacter TaxID=2635362 RepID=UPI00138F322E|nr:MULTISPECIES: hypothetical protein [unclassified Lysobacter]
MEAAWRTVRAGLREMSVDDVFAHTRHMARQWERFAMLPNCPPPFEFNELDAVRMVLDAMELQR